MSNITVQGSWNQSKSAHLLFKFVTDQCGGYLKADNPQFLLTMNQNATVTIQLTRLGNTSPIGMLFGVYKCRKN